MDKLKKPNTGRYLCARSHNRRLKRQNNVRERERKIVNSDIFAQIKQQK